MMSSTFWPASEVFLSVSLDEQISDGAAFCTAIAICDDFGHPTRTFHMGQTAHFFFEVELMSELAVPAGGVEFRDASGLVVHGKNSFQYGEALPTSVEAGTLLRYHQAIQLDIAPGEYQPSLGFASVDAATYANYCAGTLGHEQFRHKMVEHVKLKNTETFTVQFDGTKKLLHHGLANLPGTCTLVETQKKSKLSALGRNVPEASALQQTTKSILGRFFSYTRTISRANEIPAIIHITHWKAGSQWIYKILRECAPEHVVEPELNQAQFLNWPVHQGKIYPTVYVTKQEYDRVRLPQNVQRFVVIRDLRDTLVSAYFSMKISHPVLDAGLGRLRSTLQQLDDEEGMIYLMDEWLPPCVQIQRSWLEAGERLLRYEDLLEHDLQILEPLLIDECRLPVSRKKLQQIVLNSRFERLASGRKRGQEDVTAHERKGIAGDWRNHFTERITKAFKNRYGGMLVATGYEQNLDW